MGIKEQLQVRCPVCSAAPGQWCTFVEGEEHNGWHHVARPDGPSVPSGGGALASHFNTAHGHKKAITVALDALRKIRLGHPCDVPELIATYAIEEIEELTK